MIRAKLFILNQEIDLRWTDMRYVKHIESPGRPESKVFGGKISLCFDTREDTHELLEWMTRDSSSDDFQELSTMEDGKVCFYDFGFDSPPTKTYEFSDAHLVYYKEYSNPGAGVPLQTTITISPAIQKYNGVDHIESWNVSFVEPTEDLPYQALPVDSTRPKIYDTFYEDMDGKRVKELMIGTEVNLVIMSENVSGKTVNVDLSDKNHDFIHEGEVLENDILKDVTISGDTHKVKLKVIAQHHE